MPPRVRACRNPRLAGLRGALRLSEVFAGPRPEGPRHARLESQPTFLRGAESLLLSRVRSPAPCPRTPGGYPSPRRRCPRPLPCAPGSFGEQPCSILFRFRFGARRFSLLAGDYLAIHAPLSPVPKEALTAQRSGRRRPGLRPLGRRRGAGPDLSN